MLGILLSKDTTFIIGPVSNLLGYLMNGIFYVLNLLGTPSIGLTIILFTVIVYLCLLPLTIKQQKFSKLSSKITPEVKAIQKKYEGKQDNESIMAMNEEVKRVYRKYGVSQSGTCLQLLIQFPIFISLYRVIYNMPAYVPSIKNLFTSVVDKLANMPEAAEFIKTFQNANYHSKQFENEAFVLGSDYMKDTFIDVLNKSSSAEWASLQEKFSEISVEIGETYQKLSSYNDFFGLNIGDPPTLIIKESFASGAYGLMIAAVMVPVLAALTQYIGVLLMPQQKTNEKTGNDQTDAMMQSMKTMNYFMPIMSAVLCLTMPTGIGLYWIAGAVVRAIQQVAINKYIDRIDIDELVKKNLAKEEELLKKKGVSHQAINNGAKVNTKSITSKAKMNSGLSQKEKDKAYEEAMQRTRTNAKPGSLTAKANMVKDFNERNSR